MIDVLKISVKDGKACEKLLNVEITEDQVQQEFEKFYRAIAPKAKIPGFRPGKAPRDVLVMHYKETARENVMKNLISDSYKQAVRDKALEPLGSAEIEHVDFPNDRKFSYRARVEVRPKIKLGKVTGLKVKKEKPQVNPEEIEKGLKRVQESYAQYKAVEDRPAQKGDYVIADYVCTAEGKEVDKRENDWIPIGEEEFLKGFSEQLIGTKAGEEKDVTITFPQDYWQKEAAGKPGTFQVKIKEVKEKKLPVIDDELAKETGECKTLEELKARIEKDLLANEAKRVETEFEKTLLEELVKHNKLDVPRRVVERRLKHMVQHSLAPYLQKGQEESAHVKEMREKLGKELLPEAERQIRVAFLLDEIAVKESITAGEADVKKKVLELSQQIRQPVETIEQYYQNNQDARLGFLDQIRNDKVLDYLKQHAKVK